MHSHYLIWKYFRTLLIWHTNKEISLTFDGALNCRVQGVKEQVPLRGLVTKPPNWRKLPLIQFEGWTTITTEKVDLWRLYNEKTVGDLGVYASANVNNQSFLACFPISPDAEGKAFFLTCFCTFWHWVKSIGSQGHHFFIALSFVVIFSIVFGFRFEGGVGPATLLPAKISE